MPVQLGLTSDRRWNVDAAELVAATKRAGFTSLGIAGEQITDASINEIRKAGLQCHEVMALIISNNRRATLASAEGLAARAVAIAAQWVVTVFTATMTPETLSLVNECASILSRAGVRMAVEFSPLGSVQSIAEGLEIVDHVGPGRSGVLIDTWHFFRGPSTWPDLDHVPLERIAYVQFADALEPASEDLMDETMNRRAMPGTGMLDLARFAETLRRRRWTGLVSVEVLSRQLGAKPIEDFARTAHELTARYWSY